MLRTRFFRPLGQHSGRRQAIPARPRRSFIPRLIVLEDRTVPSTFTVTSLNDMGPGTLRAGVASGANTIRFAPGLHGTITLSSEIDITSSLTIDGPGARQLTVSGGNSTRVFDVSGSATHLTIDRLTIANGLALPSAFLPGLAAFGGGLLNDGANVSLSQDVFVGNQAGNGTSYAGGGAIANIGGAHLTVHQTNFLANTANGGTNFGNGGAVDDDQSSIVDIENSTFVANFATGGNANGGAITHYDNSQLTLANCSFVSNRVLVVFPEFGSGAGGAIETDEGGSGFFGDQGQPTMTIAQCSFTGNHCDAGPSPAGQAGGATAGGAVDVEDRAKVTVSNSTFAGNRVRGGDGGDGSAGMDGGQGGNAVGGAIFNNSAHLTVSNSHFLGNETHGGSGGAGGGGGNGGDGAAFTLGGAIDATFSDTSLPPTTTLSNCQFVGNQAIGGDGGAGGGGGNGGNGMRGDGGAVINLLGTITVTNCSLVGNTSRGGAGGAPGSGGVGGDGGLGRGGGFSNERGGTATVTNTVIAGNQAIGGAGAVGGNGGNAVGGGVYNGRFTNQEASLEMINCTVSANLALGGTGGAGGNGGFASGGGIYNGTTDAAGNPLSGSPTLDLDGTNVTGNRAAGGAAGSGGVAGTGVGGGLSNDSPNGAVAEVDAQSTIKGNKATTSNDDIFGSVTPI
jgi:hypothetical protein